MTIKVMVYGSDDYAAGIKPVYTEIDTQLEEIEPEAIKDIVLKLSESFGDLWDCPITISFSHQPNLVYRRVYTGKGEVLIDIQHVIEEAQPTIYF